MGIPRYPRSLVISRSWERMLIVWRQEEGASQMSVLLSEISANLGEGFVPVDLGSC